MDEIPASGAPRVSVIIPSAAASELLAACLRSLARHAPKGIPFETIVVLNNATSASEARIQGAFSGVQVLSSSVNLGLAGAGNLGRARSKGELLAILHDDAEIEPGWMEALIESADLHPEAGAIGSKVYFPDGRLQSAGNILWRDGTTSPPWVGPAPDPAAFDELRAVDYCGTSSILVRTATWDAVGGLDERFFPAYYVDVDLCMGVRHVGQVVLYEPRSRIRHHRGASMRNRFRFFVSARNRSLFLEKWERAMDQHEPPAPGSPEAITRALECARAFVPRVVRPNDALAPRTYTMPEVAALERRNLERDLAVNREYVADLSAALEASEERLRAIVRLRWWRLYHRLLPLLRRVAALSRR